MKSRKHTKPPVLAGIALLAIVTLCWFSRTRQGSPPHPASTAHPPVGSMPVASLPVRPESLADFSRWLETHATASATGRAPVTPEVIRLARERRVAMESLIRTDPRLALENAVTLAEWNSLPGELRAEVEEPFSAMARYQVLPVCGHGTPGQNLPDAVRLISIDGQPQLTTHVFGTRIGITSKEEAPVQGIRLGRLAALHEKTFRELSAEETPAATAIYPLANPHADRDFATGGPLGDSPVTALAGGKVFLFADHGSFRNFADAIDALDKTPAPHGGSALVFRAYPADGNGGFNLGQITTANTVLASAWTETKKKVFIIRCDFSDKPDSPSSPTPVPSTYASLLNTTVSDTIKDFSYGKTWIEATVSPTVVRLDQVSTHYSALDVEGSSDNTALRNEAIAKYASTPGFNVNNYDIVGVWFTSINMRNLGLAYAGLAGGNALWIQGNEDAEVHVHEFGHNYGIGHSSFWKPSVGSTNPFDNSGTHDEYGDPFDVMGGGPVPQGVFHSQAKQRLNWLGTGEWTDATASGSATHRLYRIDDAATAGVRGVRVTKGADEYLWLSYRRLFANNALRAGANIVWEKAGEDQGWLIDTTPGSLSGTSDRTDGSLAIGRTFSTGNSHITPLARGGSGSGEWLDVRVNTGPFSGNTAPVATLSGPSTIAARQSVVFTAQATDPDGDPLAYSWDFGQGFTFDNNPSATFSWTVGGTFTVKVTASDMKGATTQATKTVTVTDDITTWTARSHPSNSEIYDLAANGSKVIGVGHEILSSTNGTNWTASELALNGQGYAGIWDGTRFVVVGEDYSFDAPVGWRGAIFTSPDASAGTWTRQLFTGTRLNDVAYGNGVHIAIADGGVIRRSTDGGVNWSPVTSGTTHSLSSVAYGSGKFVIVGRASPFVTGNPVVLTSPDGQAWTDTTIGSGLESWHDFQSVNWAGDRFLASGWYSKLRHSTDAGASFSTTRTINEHTPGIAYGNGIWFAAGTEYGGSGADLDLVSADGVNWTNLPVPAVDDRRAAIFFNNTFITVGANRSIRQSGTITPGTGGYFAWRESNFPDHGPASTPDGDQDGDGADNLIEYALGRSPVSGNGSDGPASLPQALVTAGEPTLAGRLVLQASIPEPSVGDVVHVVEASSSLTGSWSTLATKTGSGSWTWNAGGTSRIVTSAPSGGRVTVKVGDSVTIAEEAHRFLRLRAVVNQ